MSRVAKFLGIVLIALIVAVSSVQCVAACTPSQGATPPPCHHHKQQAPPACSHELVPATTVPTYHADITFTAEPVVIASGDLAASVEMPSVQTASPPNRGSDPPSVLRI